MSNFFKRPAKGFAPEIQGRATAAQHQALTQLEVLGYKPGDRIWLRLLVPKHTPESCLLDSGLGWRDDKGRIRKCTIDGYLTLREGQMPTFTRVYAGHKEPKTWDDGLGILKYWNRKGYGVYLGVNPGGREDDDVAECRVVFWENDVLCKEHQWKRLRFLERRADKRASLVIETKKSLHCYLALSEPINPEQWVIWQKRIIQGLDSDPCIRNLARLMRLAGFDHVSWNVEFNRFDFLPIKIVQQADTEWEESELDDCLPELDLDYWQEQPEVGAAAPSDPIDNLWDIRNFASYLAGYDSEGRKDWIVAKCPAHNGESFDSLHINRVTGQFKCHGGCQSREVYAAARAVAIAAGYNFPDPEEPDPREYAALVQQQAEQEQAENSFAARAKQERIEASRKRTEAIQSELNSLRVLPTVKESGLYIPKGAIHLPERSGIVLIDAPKNSGKTSNGLAAIVAQHRERYPNAPQWLGVPRRILARQAGKTLGLPIVGPNSQFPVRQGALCLESNGKLGDFDYLPQDQPPLLILDEPSQTLKQLLYGDTTKGNQAFVLSRLWALFKAIADRGGWVVLCEDSLTNLELDIVAETSGLEVVEYFKFEKEITPRDFKIYDSSTLTWDEIQERLYKGENLIAASDSQRWLREIERHITTSGILDEIEAWVIDRDSAEDSWVREFVDDPVRWARGVKPRFLGYSPTLSSGVSIKDPDGHFAAQAFHITHLEPRDAAQLVDRLRSNVPRFGYVKEFGGLPDDLMSSCRPDAILRDLDRNKEGIAKLSGFAEYIRQQEQTDDLMQTMQRLNQEKDDPTTDYGRYRRYFARYKARENYNRMNLRDGVIARWQAEGHNVAFQPLGKITHCVEERQEARKAIDLDESKAFAEADTDNLTVAQARLILDQLGNTKVERRIARKRLLQDKLPGCPLNEQNFVLKVIVENSGRFLRSVELLWLSQNPEAAQFLDRISWHGAYSHADKRGLFVIDHKLSVRSGQAKLLSECPLEPFISGAVEKWDNETPEAIAVKAWAVLHARPFKRYS